MTTAANTTAGTTSENNVAIYTSNDDQQEMPQAAVKVFLIPKHQLFLISASMPGMRWTIMTLRDGKGGKH